MKKQIAIALLIFAVIIAATVALVKTGPKPKRRQQEKTAQLVTAIKASRIAFSPVVNGFGEAKPAKTWAAITQIPGKIIEISPSLQNGKFLKAGAVIAKIDDTECRLSLAKSQADVAKIQANISQLDTKLKNLTAQKAIQDQMLELNKKDLERSKTLRAKDQLSQQALEKEMLTVLQQESAIASMQAELNLIPNQLASYQAELEAANASLEQARLNVGYAVITAPFSGRVTEANAELQQYASVGSVLCKLDSIENAEVETSLAPETLAILPPGDLDKDNPRPALLSNLEFSVETANADAFRWQAKFLRFSEKIDSNTRMVSIVLGVDNPYSRDKGDQLHMPLSRGLFCKVSIKAAPRSEIILPRSAIHENQVYAVENGVLAIRPVKVKYHLGTYSIIAEGVNPDDTIIVSDIVPVIPGMAVSPTFNDDYAEQTAQALK